MILKLDYWTTELAVRTLSLPLSMQIQPSMTIDRLEIYNPLPLTGPMIIADIDNKTPLLASLYLDRNKMIGTVNAKSLGRCIVDKWHQYHDDGDDDGDCLRMTWKLNPNRHGVMRNPNATVRMMGWSSTESIASKLSLVDCQAETGQITLAITFTSTKIGSWSFRLFEVKQGALRPLDDTTEFQGSSVDGEQLKVQRSVTVEQRPVEIVGMSWTTNHKLSFTNSILIYN